jgi:hypothetical protein
VAKRRKNGLGQGSTIVVAIVAILISAKLLIDYWPHFLGIAAVYAIYYYRSSKKPDVSQAITPVASQAVVLSTFADTKKTVHTAASRVAKPPASIVLASGSPADEPEELRSYLSASPPHPLRNFSIPAAPDELKNTRWLNNLESINIAGIQITP